MAKKKTALIFMKGKMNIVQKMYFLQKTPRFGFLNHRVHSSFFVSDWQVIFVYPREM